LKIPNTKQDWQSGAGGLHSKTSSQKKTKKQKNTKQKFLGAIPHFKTYSVI
jgi:hypothetical protein